MNLEAKTKAIVLLDQFAAAAKAHSAVLRDELEAEARADYETTGGALSRKFPNLGRVVLPLTDEAAVVADEDALLAWVKARRADQVETVERVRPAFITWLLGAVTCTDGMAVLEDEVVPGLAVREGGQPKSLSITPDKAAKDLFAEVADSELRQLAAGPLAGVLALPEAGAA